MKPKLVRVVVQGRSFSLSLSVCNTLLSGCWVVLDILFSLLHAF